MIRGILFDFDGVIVESADIKTQAFRELFKDCPQKMDAIVSYHLLNSGISRYVKFRYIYEHILGEKYSEDKEVELGKCFSGIVFDKVLKAPLVPGAMEFLDRNRDRYQFFIISGTPEEELKKIIFDKGLGTYFKEIWGSPKEKTDIICNIMQRYGFNKKELVYIGDAESDRIAAKEAGLIFIERKSDFKVKPGADCWIIRDLTELNKSLQDIQQRYS